MIIPLSNFSPFIGTEALEIQHFLPAWLTYHVMYNSARTLEKFSLPYYNKKLLKMQRYWNSQNATKQQNCIKFINWELLTFATTQLSARPWLQNRELKINESHVSSREHAKHNASMTVQSLIEQKLYNVVPRKV